MYGGLGKHFCYSLALSDCNSDEELSHAFQEAADMNSSGIFFCNVMVNQEKVS